MPPPSTVLDKRTLNRTLLERQGLLRRMDRTPAEVITRLVGLQAQEPQNPFVAVWNRVDPFDPADLDRLLLDRLAVRTGLMRTTLHLVTAEDAIALRPLFAPILARTLVSQRAFRIGLEGLDLDEVAAFGAGLLGAEPMSATQLRPHLAERWPDRDPAVLMMAVRYLVPLVQVPPRGLWRQSRQPILTTLEAWLDRAPAAQGDVDGLVLRYLAAFGPASTADIRTWSWLANLASVIDRLRPGLRTYRDESGRELLDLPDAPIVGGHVPAPPRFLPEYDNIFLSHADRSRIADMPLDLERYSRGTLLVDGFVTAGWRIDRHKDRTTLRIDTFRQLRADETDAVRAEANELLRFMIPEVVRPEIEFRSTPQGVGKPTTAGRDG